MGTRPWKVFGEGPIADADIAINNQGFNDGAYTKAGASEIRFTQKAGTLYATALAWPDDGQIIIRHLAEGSDLYPEKIHKVRLLGYGKVKYTRTADGLIVTLPDKPCNTIAPVLKIE